MHFGGTRHPRAEHNPLRSLPLFCPAAAVVRSTETDRLIGALRSALYAVDGWKQSYGAARAALGQANRSTLQFRRANQRDAMRKLNAVRGAMRANLRLIATTEITLLAAGIAPSAWAIVGRV